MKILRNVLAVVVGVIAGWIVNMSLIVASPHIIPPPEGVNVSDMQSLSESMHLFEPKHFVFPFLAHALGTLAGGPGSVPRFRQLPIGVRVRHRGVLPARRDRGLVDDPRAGVVRRPRPRGLRPDGVSRHAARTQDSEAKTSSESRWTSARHDGGMKWQSKRRTRSASGMTAARRTRRASTPGRS